MGNATQAELLFRGEVLTGLRALGSGGTGTAYTVRWKNRVAVAKVSTDREALGRQTILLGRYRELGFKAPRVLDYSEADGVIILELVRGYTADELEQMKADGVLSAQFVSDAMERSNAVEAEIRSIAVLDPVIRKVFEPYGNAGLLVDAIYCDGYWWLVDP